MIAYRFARSPHDLPLVRELFLEYQRAIDVDLCFQQFDQELAALPGRYAPPAGCIILAFVEVRPAGCVALREIADGTCEMKRLYIRPAFRGLGMGRELAERVIAEARRIGHRRMMLDTLDTMTTARAIYRALGFVEADAYTHNPLPNVHYMQLELC